MTTRKGILKFLIVFILVVFLLATGLMSILYLGGSKKSVDIGDMLTGDAASGAIVETGVELSGTIE